MQKIRRRERQIELDEIEQVVAQCHVVHTAMFDDPFPYVVPTNYGYEWIDDHLVLYLHGARQGKKLTCIKRNPHVCVEIDTGAELMPHGQDAPKYSAAYQSVIGFGTATIVADDDLTTKQHALDLLMQHETGRSLATFDKLDPRQIAGVGVIKIEVAELTGKAHRKS